ncbi:RluA family pseudouridine synthase [Vibrio sp.]|nr:RluA family pseudouridine synthase [Vibrio sp.]
MMFKYKPPLSPWIDIHYEDDDILIANKQSGLLSVPGRLVEHRDSLWSRLQEVYPEIQPIHRLDMDTSGVMLFAKNKAAESELKKQFQYRLTHKVYYARVWGTPNESKGTIDLPLISDWDNRPRQKVCNNTGKQSLTYFELLATEELTSVVRLLPITGRSHQLRVHMQSLGHPIVGDEFYAHSDAYQWASRLELHAAELSFYHPKTQALITAFIDSALFSAGEAVIATCFDIPLKRPDYKKAP